MASYLRRIWGRFRITEGCFLYNTAQNDGDVSARFWMSVYQSPAAVQTDQRRAGKLFQRITLTFGLGLPKNRSRISGSE